MERNDQALRRNSRQAYAQRRHPGESVTGRQSSTESDVRSNLRQSSLSQQSPESGRSTGRIGARAQSFYEFTPNAQHGSVLPSTSQYGQGVAAEDASRSQGQQYAQYGSNLMYDMSQPQGGQPSQPSYEQVAQYRQGANIASETMTATFGSPQYYLSGQVVPTGVTAAELGAQNISAQFPPDAGASAMHGFLANIMDPIQPPDYNPYAQQTQYPTQAQVSANEQSFDNYQNQMREIFTLVRNGSLRDVGPRLLEVSQYLLGNVEPLGLTRDDEQLHDGRVRLWDEFNRAWLVSLQRQFDLAQRLGSGQTLEQGQSIMDVATLDRLSSELVRLCDSIEKHGLVDYQMGVAEEDIMEILLRCLSQLNAPNVEAGESSGASRGR